MSRMLRLAMLVFAGTILVLRPAAPASAQSGRSPGSPEQSDRGGQSGRRRPQGQSPQAQPLPPRLEQILKNWSQATKGIEKLEGTHARWVYDRVNQVVKEASGNFYYEAPDQGRIDIQPREPASKTTEVPDYVEREIDGRTVRKRVTKEYACQADQPERWVCDGEAILQIDDELEEVHRIPLSPEMQGKNIMDGPLPFLFGMPPEKAKQRYRFQLLEARNPFPKAVWLNVQPRWQRDAANWKEAQVILNPNNRYLPIAVKLIDPSENRKTVYRFGDFKINARRPLLDWLKGSDPFDPDLDGYKVVQHKGAGDPSRPGPAPDRSIRGQQKPGRQPQKQQGPTVPPVVRSKWTDAKKQIEKHGYEVKWRKGRPAPREELTGVIYAQRPEPDTPLEKGGTVTLWYFNKPSAQTAEAGEN